MDYVPILPLCRAYKQEIDKIPYNPVYPASGFFRVLQDQIIYIQAHPNTVHKFQPALTCTPHAASFYNWLLVFRDDYISPNGFQNIGLFDFFKERFVLVQNHIQDADRNLVAAMKEEAKIINSHLNSLSYVKGFLLYFPAYLEAHLLSIPIVANPKVPEDKCFLKQQTLKQA